jgi:hypothetical protein
MHSVAIAPGQPKVVPELSRTLRKLRPIQWQAAPTPIESAYWDSLKARQTFEELRSLTRDRGF